MNEPYIPALARELASLQIYSPDAAKPTECNLVLRVAGSPDSLHIFSGTERECVAARRRIHTLGATVPVMVAAIQLARAIRDQLSLAPSQPLPSDTSE